MDGERREKRLCVPELAPQIIKGRARSTTFTEIRTAVMLEKWGRIVDRSRPVPPPATPRIEPPQAGQVESDRSTSSRQEGHILTLARIPRSVISQEAILDSRDIFHWLFFHSQRVPRNPRSPIRDIPRSKKDRTICARKCIRRV
jgi:hypothetical protein